MLHTNDIARLVFNIFKLLLIFSSKVRIAMMIANLLRGDGT